MIVGGFPAGIIDCFRDRRIQKLERILLVVVLDLQANAADEVGDLPFHAHKILIAQKSADTT